MSTKNSNLIISGKRVGISYSTLLKRVEQLKAELELLNVQILTVEISQAIDKNPCKTSGQLANHPEALNRPTIPSKD